MAKPVCVIVGVGPGNGAAFARKFQREGYAVVLVARHREYLEALVRDIPDSVAQPCDVTDPEALARMVDTVERDVGAIEVAVYNAGNGVFGTVEDVPLADFETAWRVNVYGLVALAKDVLPRMRRRGYGNLCIIGATASLRGGANFAAFAAAKAGQRALAQSMARHVGKYGVHVSYVIVDGVIDSARGRAVFPHEHDEFFLQAEDIAGAVFDLVRQPRSAWSFEIDLRPFAEKW